MRERGPEGREEGCSKGLSGIEATNYTAQAHNVLTKREKGWKDSSRRVQRRTKGVGKEVVKGGVTGKEVVCFKADPEGGIYSDAETWVEIRRQQGRRLYFSTGRNYRQSVDHA